MSVGEERGSVIYRFVQGSRHTCSASSVVRTTIMTIVFVRLLVSARRGAEARSPC